MTVDQTRLYATTDASVWAEEFCKEFSIFTEEGVVEDKIGLMIGWFANAIETAKAREFGEGTPILCVNCGKAIVDHGPLVECYPEREGKAE